MIMKVIVEFRHSQGIEASMSLGAFAEVAASIEKDIDFGFKLDANFASVQIPRLKSHSEGAVFSLEQPFSFSMERKRRVPILCAARFRATCKISKKRYQVYTGRPM